MSADSVVQITISRETSVVSRPGFGVPMLCAYHTKWPERARVYSGVDALVTDGFAITDPVYLMASALMAQEPKVQSFVVGRRALPPTQIVECAPIAHDTTKYTVKINATPYEFTSDASATVQEIVEGLAAAVNASAWQATHNYAIGDHVANDTGKVYVCRDAGESAGSGGPTGVAVGIIDGGCIWDYLGPVQAVTASEDNATLTLTADVAGTLFTLELGEDYQPADLWAREDVTTDPGIASDLAAIFLENANWYGLQLDSQSKAEIVAAASWVESNKRLFIPSSADTACGTTATDDVMSTLKTASRLRTAVIYHPKTHQYAGVAWMGEEFPKDPGKSIFKFKTLSGVDVVGLNDTQIANIKAKNGNYYAVVGGHNWTMSGITPAGEWIDVIRDLDWFEANLKADVLDLLGNVDKLPYDDGGITAMQSLVQKRVDETADVGIFRKDPAPVVTAPKLMDVAVSDRAGRILPDIDFVAYLAGAIQENHIDGVVAV